jgi:hypothetical protein
MSSDNVMNQIYSLKQFFTDLGCVPKSLQHIIITHFLNPKKYQKYIQPTKFTRLKMVFLLSKRE